MGLGLWLHLGEHHVHEHVHDAIEHSTLIGMTSSIDIPMHSSGTALSRIRILIGTNPASTGTFTFRISIIGIGMGETRPDEAIAALRLVDPVCSSLGLARFR
jgi:hypothetical protein